jgi:hypothetical protein
MSQTHGILKAQGLVSMVDEEDTQNWGPWIFAAVGCVLFGRKLSWSSKTLVMSSPRQLDGIAGFRWFTNSHHMMNWWSLSPYSCNAPNSAPYCPRTASASLYPTKVVQEICLVSVNWNVSILCSLSLFVAGNNGPSFHLQSLCAEEMIPVSLITLQKFFTSIHTSFLQSDARRLDTHLAHTLWCWCTSCIIRSAEPWLLSRCNATVFSFNVLLFLWCIGSVRPTSAISFSFTWHPILELPVHSYTYCSNKQASPYRAFILLWISIGFTPSLFIKRITERCSYLGHVSGKAAIFNCSDNVKHPVRWYLG